MESARLEALRAQDAVSGLKAIIAIHSTRLEQQVCRYLACLDDMAQSRRCIPLAAGTGYKARWQKPAGQQT